MTQKERENVVGRLVAYGNCDPICYIADEPKKLHIKQKKLYDPLIDWAQKFLSIKLNKGPDLLFIEQPSLNSGKIKQSLEELDDFHFTHWRTAQIDTGGQLDDFAKIGRGDASF